MRTSVSVAAAVLFSLSSQLQAAESASTNQHFIASTAELKARIAKELRITKPDYVVFVPEVADEGASDTGNEHFLVFDGPDGSLMAVWTQSSVENFSPDTPPDQHIVFSQSIDEGKTWAKPRIVAGPKKSGDGFMASWRYVLFIHDNDGKFTGYRPEPIVTGFNRRPIYLVGGRFQPGAEQPVWFDDLKLFMDHDNVSLGKPGTSGRFDLSLYASFTCRKDVPVLWYPDRKFFLLGRVISDKWSAKGPQ